MKEKVEEMPFHVAVHYSPYPLVLGQWRKSPDALHLLCTLAFLVIFINHNVKLSWCQFLRICSYRFSLLLTLSIILGHSAPPLDDSAIRNSYRCSTQPLVHPVTRISNSRMPFIRHIPRLCFSFSFLFFFTHETSLFFCIFFLSYISLSGLSVLPGFTQIFTQFRFH